MHASNGILFNHESPLRGIGFITCKVSDVVARIKLGVAKEAWLGKIGGWRDLVFAGDCGEAMWPMLQQPAGDDLVNATGVTTNVREMCCIVFECVCLHCEDHVVSDPALYRSAEMDMLLDDASKARQILGWKAHNSLQQLVEMMVEADDVRRLG